MIGKPVEGAALAKLRDARRAMSFEERQRFRHGTVRKKRGQFVGVFDRHRRSLGGKRHHRMCGVADQNRLSAVLPCA